MPLAMFLLALATRLYRIEKPPGVVFDEFHFGRFLNQYSKGEYFFDIHPPLGKLLMLFFSWMVDYDADVCSYKSIHHQYAEDCKFVAIRIFCAVVGCISVPLVYSVVRRFGGSMWAAVLSSTLFMLDNLNLIESRLILTDSQLMLSKLLCLWVSQRFFERWDRHCAAEDAIAKDPALIANPSARAQLGELTFGKRMAWLTLLGVACCASISVKWTGLATPALVALEVTFALFFIRRPLPLLDILYIGFVVIMVYSLQWAVHFELLPLAGDGDAFMRLEFQKQLQGNQHYEEGYKQNFWLSMWQLNSEMLSANARIEVPHHWMSKWFSWPLNQRGVLYYSNTMEDGAVQLVYLIGNPAVLWFVLFTIFVSCALLLVYLRVRYQLAFSPLQHRFFSTLAYITLGYVLNLMPYIAVNRAAFVYHYMPALLYGEILAGVMLDRLFGKDVFPSVAKFIIVGVVGVWLIFAPWVYGIPISNEAHARRRWLPGWD